MPLSHVTLTPGAIDPADRQTLVEAITTAGMRAESVPDENRRRSIVVLHEQPAGSFTWGGEVLDGQMRAVFVDFVSSVGVMDAARKNQFVADIHAAIAAATQAGDARGVFSSVIFHEVAEGDWGRNGAVRRLPDFARDAGFTHLRSIAAA